MATDLSPARALLAAASIVAIGLLVAACPKPSADGAAPSKVKDGASSGEVKLTYQFAQVATEQPGWVKAGSATSAAPSAPGAPALK